MPGVNMNRIQTFPMPDVGEGLTEAEILTWHVAVGDVLTVNQIIVEIETAKAAVELPSPFAGRVKALLVEPGVTVDVGTPIISIDTDPDAGEEDPVVDELRVDQAGVPEALAPGTAAPGTAVPGTAAPEAAVPVGDGETGAKIGEMTADGRIATLVGYVSASASTVRRARRGGTSQPVEESEVVTSVEVWPSPVEPPMRAPRAAPQVRKLAKDLGIDLATVTPSRSDGVISRAEVEAAASIIAPSPSPSLLPSFLPESSPTPKSGGPAELGVREYRVPIRGIRKMTAQAMVASAFTAPHVTEFLTVDVTAMTELRDRLRKRPEFAEVKLSPLAFAASAVCLAARRTPEINSLWNGESGEIVVKEYVNLGVAAATPRGLIVPVIADADQLNLHGLAVALGELTAKARAGRTAPAEMTGGTFTITNVGVFGVDTGTPIINPGESAILALGSIKDAPWVVDGQLAVRKVCQLSLSFDHRVIDGQQGSQFLADVGALLADPALSLVF